MKENELEKMYQELLEPRTNWSSNFLKLKRAEKVIIKSLGVSISELQTLNETKLEELVREQCIKETYVGKKWDQKPFASKQWGRNRYKFDILSINLIHHLTGFLPKLSEEDKEKVNEQLKQEIYSMRRVSICKPSHILRLGAFKELFGIIPEDKPSANMYWKLSHPFEGQSTWTTELAQWYEIVGKKPKDLLSAFEDKPLIEVDNRRASELAEKIFNEKFDNHKSLYWHARKEKEPLFLELGDKLAKKYGLTKNRVKREPIYSLEREISPKDHDHLINTIYRQLTKQSVIQITYREKMWEEMYAIYEDGFLIEDIVDPSPHRTKIRSRVVKRYYQGKLYQGGYGTNPNLDHDFTKREDFECDNFLLDLYVLDKIFGPPKEETVKTFMKNKRCWPKLKKEIRETFGERWAIS